MNDKYKFDSESFGKRLAKIRVFNKLTQEKVAEFIGVSVKSVQCWEQGKKIPGVDNLAALANCFNMTIGEILEDEAYRIFEKNAESRKRSIEIIEVPGKIEMFMEFKEDRFYDRYELWIWDEYANYEKMYCSCKKLISYKEFKDCMLDQSELIVNEYRNWLFSVLKETDEDQDIKYQIEKKIKCEEAGLASYGAVCVDGKVYYMTSETAVEKDNNLNRIHIIE